MVSSQHASVEDVKDKIEAMAAQDAEGDLTIRKGEQEVLRMIKDMIINNIKNDEVYKTTQESIDAAKAGIENCTNSAQEDFSIRTSEEAVNSSRIDHSTCRRKEVEECDDKTKKCNARDALRKQSEPPLFV